MKRWILAMIMVMGSTMGFSQAPYALRFSDFPILSRDQRESLDVKALMAKTQLELDKLYSQLTAGPLPNGFYEGYVKFDDSSDNDIERLLAISLPPQLEDWFKSIGVGLWKGKTFNKDQKTCTTSVGFVKRFPAKIYCGQSLLDSRRESIILDHAFNDTVSGYVSAIDWPMGRKGLGVRDEIRMVKPGLYLGRAYLKGIYALNFILFSPDEAKKYDWTEVCRQ
jgi:hypothetical protein